MPSRWVRAGALLLLVGLGLYLRTIGFSSGLWLDELLSLHCSRGGDVGGVLSLARAGLTIHDPVYFVLLNVITRIFGESELVIRLPSLLLGGVVLPLLVYLVLRRPWGRGAAATAMALVLLHPRLVYNSHNARAYALAEACVLVVALGLVLALRGRLAGRILGWTAGLLAAYTHKLFLCLLPALALAPLLIRRRHGYPWRKVLLDGSLALLALLPLLEGLLAAVRDGGAATYWVPELNFRAVERLLVPGFLWVLAVWLLLAVILKLNGVPARRVKLRDSRQGESGGLTAFFLLVVGIQGTMVLLFTARGGNLLSERYTTALIIACCCLIARLISAWPKPLAAAVLLVLAYGALDRKTLPENWIQYWREAGERVDALEPGDDPVLLWTGQAESEDLLGPRPPSPELLSLLDCPLRIHLGHPDRQLVFVPLPMSWGKPGHAEYFERAVVPALQGAHRFFLVAPPNYPPYFEDWLSRRFPGAQRTSVAGLYPPVEVLVYELR